MFKVGELVVVDPRGELSFPGGVLFVPGDIGLVLDARLGTHLVLVNGSRVTIHEAYLARPAAEAVDPVVERKRQRLKRQKGTCRNGN